jgi:septal ring factor EnvC (AmiA/AmiB activator)
MTMSIDDTYAGIPSTVSGRERALPASTSLPTAWQATADNKVTRHFSAAATTAAHHASDQTKVVDHRLAAMQSVLSASKEAVTELQKRVTETADALRAPDSELATAQQALLDLQKRNDQLIKQCRMWKRRTEEAKQTAEQYETALNAAREQRETPEVMFFIRRHTPGDSVRYLAGEVMKHAEGNMELAGLAVALKMVAADVDRLPQGRP